MESAEHELLRSLGLSVLPDATSHETSVTWPRVAANCDYLSVARFEDSLSIDVEVVKLGTSSVRYRFSFTRDGDAIATGSMTSVCCFLEPGGKLTKTEIPREIRGLLSRHSVAE